MARSRDRYFALDGFDGRRAGLIRRRENGGLRYEYARDGAWVRDPDLIRYFRDDVRLVELTRSEARTQAGTLGVALDG